MQDSATVCIVVKNVYLSKITYLIKILICTSSCR